MGSEIFTTYPHSPTHVGGSRGSIQVAEVQVYNPDDGTIDAKLLTSRAVMVRVPTPAWYLPTVGDRVFVTDRDGDPRQPICLGFLAPRDGSLAAPQTRFPPTPAPGFKVYRNAAQNVGDGSQLQFDAAAYDPDGLFNFTNFQFVAPRAGLYQFTAQYGMQGAPGTIDAYWAVRYWKNGTSTGTSYEGPRTPNRGGFPILVDAPLTVQLAIGDTIQAHVTIGAAIAGSALQTGETTTWFAGAFVRP